jgi:hypothetical protein
VLDRGACLASSERRRCFIFFIFFWLSSDRISTRTGKTIQLPAQTIDPGKRSRPGLLFFCVNERSIWSCTCTGNNRTDLGDRVRPQRPRSCLVFFFDCRSDLHDLCSSVKNSSVQTKKKDDDQRYAKQDLNLKLSCRKDRGP